MNKIRYIKGYKVTGRKIIALVLAMMIAGSVLLLPSSPTKTTRAENIDTTEESTTAAEEVSEPTTASDTEESTTAETTEPTMEATTALDGETPTMTEPDTDEPTTVEDLGMEEPTTMSEPTTAAPTTTVGIEPADAPLGLGAVLPPSDGTSSNLNEFVTSLVITDAAGNILPLDETSTFKVGNYYKFSLTFEEQTLDQFGVGLDNDSGEYVMTYTIPDQLYIPAESYGNPVYALLPDGSRAQFANGGGDVILGTYDIVKDDTTDSWIAVFHFTENIEDINTDPNGTPDWVQLNVGGIDPITGETITADQPIYFFTNPTSANMIMDFDAQFTQSGSGNEIDFGGAYSQGTWSIQPAATPSLNISKSADGQDLSAYTSQFTITVTAKDGDVGNLMLRDWCKSATNIDPETDMTIVSVTFKGVSAVPDATMTEDVDYKITYETAGDGKIYFILTFRDDLVLPQDRSIVIVTEYNIKPQIQYAIDNNMVYDGTQVDTLLNFNLWIQNNVQAFGSGTGHNGQPIQTDEIYASSNYTRNFMDKGAGSDLYGNASWTYWYVGDGSTSVNGVKVTDFLPDGLVFTDTTTIYANLKNKDSVIVATIPVQLTEGSTSFSFTVPGESDPIPGGSGTYGKIYFVTLSDPYNTNISGVWKSDGWYHNRLTLEGGGLDGSKDVGVYINRPRPANTDMTKTGKFVYDADGTPYAEWTIQYTISGALYNYPVFITDKADMNWFTNGGQTPLINFVPDKNNTTVTYTTVDDDNNPVSGTLDWGADWGEGYVIQHARPNDGYNGPSDWLFSFNTNWNTVNINGVDTSTQDILYPMTNVQWIYTNPANTDWVSLSPFKHDTVLTITYRMPLATTYLLGEGDVVTDTSVLDVLNENDVTFSKYN
ncbi:MAG: hypothetical protein FWD71_19465, partial [Oscillospiraceae bacterium]|nr:hypothetical protein [Oscillospiraceae bacterium]